MKRQHILVIALLVAGLVRAPAADAHAQQAEPVVHAVLFYSPTCPHCEYVITETLPLLYEKYGAQLQILGFDVTHPQGQAMFSSALDRFGLQSAGVPLLVIDNITLVGSEDIPAQLPDLVDAYLSVGGVDWPDIPGLKEMLTSAAEAAIAQPPTQAAAQPATPVPTPGVIRVDPVEVGWQARFAADREANTVAVIVLVGMIAALAWGVILFRRGQGILLTDEMRAWIIPAVCLAGLAVAGYLAYVEATDVSAVCGPIGDCNTVQKSPYARLFGLLSIGALGLIGYTAIFIAWLVARYGRGAAAASANIVLFLMALLGTLFSLYLTFLEPFVIGATCAWCLTSAILITALMLLCAGPAGRAFSKPQLTAKRPQRTRAT